MFLLTCRNLRFLFTLLLVVITVRSGVANPWVTETELQTTRSGVATAVVNSKIYIIGGVSYNNRGGPGWDALSTVDVYDTRTDTWQQAADMPTPRITPQAAVFGGDIYVMGGYTRGKVRGQDHQKIVEVYDTRTDTWTKARSMPTLRSGFKTAVVDGKIYAIGGIVLDKQRGVQVETDLVEAYDPLADRWEKRASMPTERAWIGIAVVDEKIYAIGGRVSAERGVALADHFSPSIEEYNPRTNRWRELPDMPELRFSFATAAVDKKIYLIGGFTLDNHVERLASVVSYEPGLNRWGNAPPMPIAKIGPAVAVNGIIYVLGGFIEGARFSATVDAFDTGFRAVDPKRKRATRWGELKKSP